MKPYDFYKHKFKLKDPEKERKIKYTEKDNYDFPFFAGKDSEGKKLNMTVLNNANESFLFIIFYFLLNVYFISFYPL